MINPNDYKPKVLELLYQPWTIEIKPYSDGGYFGRVVELKGCMTEGSDKVEVLQLLEEAQAEWLASALENGDPIPRPLGDSEYSGKIFVRTSPQLHRAVSEAAMREGVSMSQWAAEVLARAVSFQDVRLWFTQSSWSDILSTVTESLNNIESHVSALSAGSRVITSSIPASSGAGSPSGSFHNGSTADCFLEHTTVDKSENGNVTTSMQEPDRRKQEA